MIDKVIVCSVKRASKYVPEIEIRQMIGRCGRSYEQDKIGKAIILCKEDEISYANKCLFGELPSIDSNMYEVEEMAFHILPHIYSRDIDDKDSAYQWYKRSLSYFQKKPFLFEKLIKYLKDYGMIVFDGDNFRITELGKISCKFYYKPKRIFIWKQKIEKIINRDLFEDDFAIAWGLSTQKRNLYIDNELLDVFESNCLANGLFFEQDEKIDGFILYCLLKNIKIKEIKFYLKEYREDIDRMINALLHLDKFYNWGISNFLNILSIRIKKRLSYYEANLMFQSKIKNKSDLYKLLAIDCKTALDIFEKKTLICKMYGNEFFEKVVRFLKNDIK